MRAWLTFTMLVALGAACGDDGGDDNGNTPDGGGSTTPNITKVAWAPVGTCNSGTPGNYTITTTVTDSDTAASALTFSGTLTGCTGNIDKAVATINCPNAASYPATVTVKDPQNNMDTQTFLVSPCATSSVTP